MMFPEGKPAFGGNVEATLSGSTLTGSWNFGRAEVRPDNGMYKFTVTRASAPSSSNPPNGSSLLEGTVWKGDSDGGDKHYEFHFLANGEVQWDLRWNGNKSYKGTWRQAGNTITMDFHPWWTDPVIVTIAGDQMNGAWAKGQYKFTLAKVR